MIIIFQVFLCHGGFTIIINNETLEEWTKSDNISTLWSYEINLYTNNPEITESRIDDLNKILAEYGAKASWSNTYELNQNMKSIFDFQKTLLYSFLCMIALLVSVNIFSTIWTSITLRKKEFAVLKSMGMSSKQIIKMLILECIFYGLDALVYGVLISVVVMFLMYMYAVNTKYSAFYMPWNDIAFCIVSMYAVIFLAMLSRIRQITRQDIIDNIRNENI